MYEFTNTIDIRMFTFLQNASHIMWRRAVQSMYRRFISRLPRIPFWISFIIMHTAYTINCLRPPISTIHSLIRSYLSWQFISFRFVAQLIPSAAHFLLPFDEPICSTPKDFGSLDWPVGVQRILGYDSDNNYDNFRQRLSEFDFRIDIYMFYLCFGVRCVD